jgi:hypothetical protein
LIKTADAHGLRNQYLLIGARRKNLSKIKWPVNISAHMRWAEFFVAGASITSMHHASPSASAATPPAQAAFFEYLSSVCTYRRAAGAATLGTLQTTPA